MARFRHPTRRILRRAPAPLLALAALGLAACGGDEPRSASTPQDVKRDVTAALTDRETVCDQGSYATERFVNRASYGVPKYASRVEELCDKHVDEFAASSVKVTGVRVSGDRARATVVATGGSYEVGRVTLSLVLDGVWRVDGLAALDIDRPKFDAVQRRQASVAAEITPEQVDCTMRRLARLDDRELARAIIAFDPKLVADPTLVCVLRPELRKQGISSAQTSCIIRALRSTDGFVAILLREDAKETEDLFAQAASTCAASTV